MLPPIGKYICLKFLIIVLLFNAQCNTEQKFAQSKAKLVERIFTLLEKLEFGSELNLNTKFAILLSKFLIKQKVRFYEPTHYEEQIYNQLLRKLKVLVRKTHKINVNALQRKIFDNIFQKNVLLMPTTLKYGQLKANLEYESLAKNYAQLVDVGFPNSTISDLCLAAIATLEYCQLQPECLFIVITDEPSYGYQRMHQILILYVLMQHKCAASLGTTKTFALLANAHCTQAYREQNVIRSVGLPMRYRDLYLEQMTICSLFGYNEFLNWHNVLEVTSWLHEVGCICWPGPANKAMNCNCNNHINNLALVFYINAVLLLN